MASYSDVAARNSEKLPVFHMDARIPPVARKTTVRFEFESMPDIKKFLKAVVVDFPEEQIKCVQSLPGNRLDLTLRHEESVTEILYNGVTFEGRVIKPRPLGFRITYAYVQYLPTEMASQDIGEYMESYGRVVEVKRQRYDGTSIETGTRIVVMEVLSRIPSFTYIGGYRAKIWHRGQIQTCARCDETGHFAKDCPENTRRTLFHDKENEDITEKDITEATKDTDSESDDTIIEKVQEDTPDPTCSTTETQIDPDTLPFSPESEESGEETDSSGSESDEGEEQEQDNNPPDESTNTTTNTEQESSTQPDAALDPELETRAGKRPPSSPVKFPPKKLKKKPKTRSNKHSK